MELRNKRCKHYEINVVIIFFQIRYKVKVKTNLD